MSIESVEDSTSAIDEAMQGMISKLTTWTQSVETDKTIQIANKQFQFIALSIEVDPSDGTIDSDIITIYMWKVGLIPSHKEILFQNVKERLKEPFKESTYTGMVCTAVLLDIPSSPQFEETIIHPACPNKEKVLSLLQEADKKRREALEAIKAQSSLIIE